MPEYRRSERAIMLWVAALQLPVLILLALCWWFGKALGLDRGWITDILVSLAIVIPCAGGVAFAAVNLLTENPLERSRRENRCHRCSYNRAGLDETARCPECGTPPNQVTRP